MPVSTKPQHIAHPVPRAEVIRGIPLVAGDVIEATDVYAASDGTWKPAPCPGCVLGQGLEVVWVRPC